MALPAASSRIAGSRTPRVLIVDDSAVARAVMARMIDEHGSFAVAAAVPDVARALAYLESEAVDVILLDLEMPGTDGLTALPELIAAGRGAKILIVSSSAANGAAATVRALALGAADTLLKPVVSGFPGRFAEALIERMTRLVDQPEPPPISRAPARIPSGAIEAIGIGASTGGIHSLDRMLRAIPRDMPTPILITQHLPSSFIPSFAIQIGIAARRPCVVAEDRMAIRDGDIVVAPGDAHMVVVPLSGGRAAVRLSHERVANGNMPSVDPMLRSLAGIYGPRLLGVMLSGMGRDGLEGAQQVRANGGAMLVQDRESSVVWGMPGAVAGAGLADAILAPEAIGAFVASRVTQ